MEKEARPDELRARTPPWGRKPAPRTGGGTPSAGDRGSIRLPVLRPGITRLRLGPRAATNTMNRHRSTRPGHGRWTGRARGSEAFAGRRGKGADAVMEKIRGQSPLGALSTAS